MAEEDRHPCECCGLVGEHVVIEYDGKTWYHRRIEHCLSAMRCRVTDLEAALTEERALVAELRAAAGGEETKSDG